MKKRKLLFALCLFSLSSVAANDPVSQPEAPEDTVDPRRPTGQQPPAHKWGRKIFPRSVSAGALKKCICKGNRIFSFKGDDASYSKEDHSAYTKILRPLTKVAKHSRKTLSKMALRETTDGESHSKNTRDAFFNGLHKVKSLKTLGVTHEEYEYDYDPDLEQVNSLVSDVRQAPLLKGLHNPERIELCCNYNWPVRQLLKRLKNFPKPLKSLGITDGILTSQDIKFLAKFFKKTPEKQNLSLCCVKIKGQTTLPKLASLIAEKGISSLSIKSCKIIGDGNVSSLFQKNALEKLTFSDNLFKEFRRTFRSRDLWVFVSRKHPPLLKELKLGYHVNIFPIEGLPHLETLKLNLALYKSMKGFSFKRWRLNKNLKNLSIKGGAFPYKSVTKLKSFFEAGFPEGGRFHLKKADIRNPRAYESLLSSVFQSGITELAIKDCTVPYRKLNFLYQENSLQKLSFLSNYLTLACDNKPDADLPENKCLCIPRRNSTLTEVAYTGDSLKEAQELAHWVAGHKPLKVLDLGFDLENLAIFYDTLKSCPKENFPSLCSLTVEPYCPFDLPFDTEKFGALKEKITRLFFSPTLLESTEPDPSIQIALPAAEEPYPARLHKNSLL